MSKVFEFAPQGFKAGVAYAQIPNENAADFEVARNSTATYIGNDGFIKTSLANEPRYTFETGDNCATLLTEPQSTNIAPYSNDVANPVWSKAFGGTGIQPVVTSNYTISPDGSVNADRVIMQAVGVSLSNFSFVGIDSLAGLPAPHDSSISVWLKSNTLDNYTLIFFNRASTPIEIIVTPNWKRFNLSLPVTVSTERISFGLRDLAGAKSGDYADVSVYNAQVEILDKTTSDIVNVDNIINTRLEDNISGGGSLSTFNSEEGVLCVNASVILKENPDNLAFYLSDGTFNNLVKISKLFFGSTTFRFEVIVAGVVAYTHDLAIPDCENLTEMKIKWSINGFGIKINGVEVDSGLAPASIFPASTLDRLDFGDPGLNKNFHGKTKQITVYDSINDY